MSKRIDFFSESLSAWKDGRDGLIAEVDNIRATKFDFRPTPDVRSVRELVQHIVEGSMMMVGELTQPEPNFTRQSYPEFIKEFSTSVQDAQTKKELLDLLESQIKDGVRRFTKVGADAMMEPITNFDGSTWTRMQWLHHGMAEEMYHRGQVTTYARMMGLVPALTQMIEAASE